MGKIRRGGYVFVSWISDHGNHVHVYRDGRLIVKWDLDGNREEPGSPPASRRIRKLIGQLKAEGRLGYEGKEGRRQ